MNTTSPSAYYDNMAPKLSTGTHPSHRHAKTGGMFVCHNRIRLPGDLVISLLAWSKTNFKAYIGVTFFDRDEWGVDMISWYNTWYADLVVLRNNSPDMWLDWRDYGLEIVAAPGTRYKGTAEVDLTWDPEPTNGCQEGCKEYQLVQENGTDRMVLAVMPIGPSGS
jgi:hypothetical protein